MTFFKAALVLTSLGFAACSGPSNSEEIAPLTPEDSLLRQSMNFHGSSLYDSAKVAFFFRDRTYSIARNEGLFTYSSTHSDSLGVIERILSNDGFLEYVNGSLLQLSSKDSMAHAETVNSVVYFNLLPLPLQDPAVHKKIQGQERIDGRSYHRMLVTFDEEGGGVDHEDVFLYWFDVEDGSMDYLAYAFKVNGGGSRFRKAINPRRVNGILFQDYENYKGPDPQYLDSIAFYYTQQRLPLLSTIEISQIQVVNTVSAEDSPL